MALAILTTLLVLIVLAVGTWASLAARSRTMPAQVGVVAGRLAECPATPNCVSSDAEPSDAHYIAALPDPSGTTWQALLQKVARMDGAALVRADDDYAHFTFASRVFGFVDDVEFHRRPATGEIAVRSASRVGRGDLGANRRRIEAIRAGL